MSTPVEQHPTPQQPSSEASEAFEFAAETQKKRMLIIVNPYATTVSDRLRHLVVYALQGRYEVDAVDTEARGHATELCREAAHEGYDVVVAFGGDGTVNEAANGLIGSDTPLTCLPGGSANVFGKMLGIPGELVDATEHLLGMADDWRPRKVDVGVVNGRYFTFSSGVGVDASVVERVDSNPHLKARLGAYYFTWAAITTFARRYLFKPPRLTAHVDREAESDDADASGRGRRRKRGNGHSERGVDGVTAIIQNGSPFTYFQNRPIEIADGATLNSGALAGCVLRRATPLSMPFIGWRAFSGRALVTDHRHVTALPALTEMTIKSSDGRPLPLQVDGDFLGEFDEAAYSIRPQALNVVA
ncbi:MAG TPA: diacylglycerol kinase family protein [Solirubrobacteraceae bacterium]|nr:diacylglycerol kinase family protein [Solirubrobacteraceae bacterium]